MNLRGSEIRFSAALSALLLAVVLLFSSCSFVIVREGSYRDPGMTGETEQTTETTVETGDDVDPDEKDDGETKLGSAERAKARLGELAEYDCGGANFIIATASNMTFATDGEDYYDRALLLRDAMVEERYGVNIVTIFTSEGSIATEMKNARLSGDVFADAVSVPEYRVGALASEGLIRNLRSLPFWNANASRSSYALEAAAGNAVYADLGAASSDFEKVYAVFYNREVEAALGIDLAQVALDGEWTWDEYEKYALLASSKLGAYGQGSINGGDEYTDAVFWSAGITLIDNRVGKTPRISFDSETLELAVERVCELVYGNASYYKGSDFFGDLGTGDLFMGIAPLGRISEVAAECRDFGILPIPKFDIDADGYCGYTEASAAVLCVTAENNKYEMTGHILNALNTASYEYLAEEYKKHCFYNYFGSEAPLATFDLVTGSMMYDFSFIYSSGVDGLREATFGAVREARRSVSDTATKLISMRMDEVNDRLEELFGTGASDEEIIYKPTTEAPRDTDAEKEPVTEDTTEPVAVATTSPSEETEPETEIETEPGTDTEPEIITDTEGEETETDGELQTGQN